MASQRSAHVSAALLVALWGCHPTPPVAAPRPGAVRVLLETPITFEIPGRKVHCPMVLVGMDLFRGTVVAVSDDVKQPVRWLVKP